MTVAADAPPARDMPAPARDVTPEHNTDVTPEPARDAAPEPAPRPGSPGPRLRSLPRWQRVALGALALSPLLRALTYAPWADGGRRDYYAALAFFVCFAAVTWLLVRIQLRAGAVLPWLAAAGVLLPGDAAHYARLAHPTTRQRDSVVADSFADPAQGAPHPSRWITTVQPGASAGVDLGEMRIQNAPGAVGYVDLVFPENPPVPPATAFWLPRGLYRNGYVESVELDLRLQREGDFYVLLDVRTLELQVQASGVQVTLRPPGGTVTRQVLSGPQPLDNGARHHVRLARDARRMVYAVDGREQWSGPDGGPWTWVRFGESRADPLHAGQLRLDDVRYVRHYEAGLAG